MDLIKNIINFLKKIQNKKKHKLLKRVSKAQKKDPIEEGNSNDNIR